MRYLMLAVEHPTAFADREDDERADGYWQTWRGYLEALTAAGVLVDAGGLQPPGTATTVRLVDGRRQVQDGPFADTKEQLGGYFVLEVADLDEALAWASRCPSVDGGGSCEVRPLLPPRE